MGFSVVIYAHTKRSGFYVFYYLLERSTPTGSDRSDTLKKGAALHLFGACGRDIAGKNPSRGAEMPLRALEMF